MPSKHKVDNCQNFEINNVCPHRNDDLMKQYIMDLTTSNNGILTFLNFDKAKAVSEKFCSTCKNFKQC